MAASKPLIAGNWKMFGRQADLGEIALLASRVGRVSEVIDVLVCPPAPMVAVAAWRAKDTSVLIGAQDCSAVAADSARTGDVSAAMLADAGARYVIVGHSERRTIFGETDAVVRAKAEAALTAGLIPIVCVGETHSERAGGRLGEVVARQIQDSIPQTGGTFVVAYEPVWAIGGNATPTLAEIADVHDLIGKTLAGRSMGARILYGGSVNPKNAGEIFGAPGVDGALVGRASLKADDFSAIILAHPAAS
ncbi:MAG: triose-phosphate isomerase [Proteobacteria bacterium]|nr:triose-phosphate isomerase [Pseudomonadota bacterium]